MSRQPTWMGVSRIERARATARVAPHRRGLKPFFQGDRKGRPYPGRLRRPTRGRVGATLAVALALKSAPMGSPLPYYECACKSRVW